MTASNIKLISLAFYYQLVTSIALSQHFPTCVQQHACVPRERYQCAMAECQKSKTFSEVVKTH